MQDLQTGRARQERENPENTEENSLFAGPAGRKGKMKKRNVERFRRQFSFFLLVLARRAAAKGEILK
ncbi:MAG: hypothetical protein VZQ80_05665 [Lachnospiraceae bacterium]|nr:hypothetical protein [Lachnospiraceae bacterium]